MQRTWGATIIALTLVAGSGSGAAAAHAAGPESSERITLRTRPVTGTLTLTATTAKARTEVRARGTLRTRSRHVRLVLMRCGDAACGRARMSPVAGRSLPVGRHAHAVAWRTRTRAGARFRLQVRVGRGTLVSTVLRPAVTASESPAASAPSVAAPSAPAAADPAPSIAVARSVIAAPGLTPGYAPAITDYAVRCTPGTPVRISATLPPGETIAIDGARAAGGTVAHDVALAPGQSFAFTLNGAERHVVRCVPADLPAWTVERNGRPDVPFIAFAPTLNTAPDAGAYAVIADNYGVPLWWTQTPNGLVNNVEVLSDGTVAVGVRTGPARGFVESFYDRFTLDGTRLSPLSTVGIGADFHDVQLLPDGNVLLESYPKREHVDLTALGGPADATVLDALIQEVRPDGSVAWSWNSKDHIDPAETAEWGLANTKSLDGNGNALYDIVHLNSVERAPNGDVLFSARHLDAVYRIRRSDGGVVWKLGGTARPESLAFVGERPDGGSFDGQHDARLLPDGTLTLHDNGTRSGRAPRGLRYALDTGAGTATMLEDVRDPRVPTSWCCGSARRLPGGHWLMGWGGVGTITELTAQGTPVLTLRFPGQTFSYRALPVSGTVVDRTALRAGMDAQHPRSVAGG